MSKYEWDKYSNRIIIGYYREKGDVIIPSLCRLLFTTAFFSITQSDDEITVMMDESISKCITHPLEEISEYVAYNLLNIGSLLEESGLVNIIASDFTKNGIPIMYITTYNNNYVLVPVEFEGVADKILGL